MKNVLIIGLGEFGKHLAMKLNQLKCEVCVIDQKAEIINMVQSDFANAYTGDCMNIHVLEELGIKDFDSCVVAIGQNFQASLEITSHLKELGAKYIISKASSEIQSKFLLLAGANETVYPERDIAEKVAIKCNATNLLDYVKLSDEYSIYEIAVLNSWVGHNLKDLDIRNKYEINIVAIRNGKDITVPTAEYIFNSDDHLYIFGKESTIFKLEKAKNKK